MASASTRYANNDFEPEVSGSIAEEQSAYPRFNHHFNAEPDRRWQIEVQNHLVRFVRMEPGWDGYDAPPLRRDAGLFALEILQGVMRPRTPLPQVVPSSMGGVQLEWHEKGIDLEIHITAPYQWELWFQDHQDPNTPPISLELTDDLSPLRRPIQLLTAR